MMKVRLKIIVSKRFIKVLKALQAIHRYKEWEVFLNFKQKLKNKDQILPILCQKVSIKSNL